MSNWFARTQGLLRLWPVRYWITVFWQKTKTMGTDDDIAAHEGLVFFLQQQDDRALFNAARADSGTWLWQSDLPSLGYLETDNRRVYCVVQSGPNLIELAALDQESGRQHWQVMAQRCGPLTVYDGLLCFVDQAREGHLVAVQRANGALTWYIPGRHSGQAFIKCGNCGFLRTLDSTVLAFDFEH